MTIQGYELLERVGAGGFGAVYRAYQSTIGREVAVKVILPPYANQPSFIRRFEIEAQLVARLEHLHIVPLYDYWRDPEGAYIVMRWLRGGSLAESLEGGAFDLESASLLLDQVASGLTAAHNQQIVHRDLKPSNILLDEDGNAYLADFGIAMDLRRTGGSDNGRKERHPINSRSEERIHGSIQYLSPEQLLGQATTPQCDIYSLGVTLYEMLSGQHPFPGLNSVQQLYKHIDEPLPMIETLDPEVSQSVNEVIQKATAKNPKQRFKDPLVMAATFRHAAKQNRNYQTTDLVETLTRREQEILQLIIAGNTNQQIAQTLYLELSTVKWHVNRIYKKIGVRSRAQAISRARDMSLLVSANESEPESAKKTSISIVLPEPSNPYKGLRAFEPADHRDFFGREAIIARLLSRLGLSNATIPNQSTYNQSKKRAERFLAIIGPSGSGKSSLIKAGLIPALWSGQIKGSDKWFIVEMLPGERPLDNLEIALTRIAADQAGNLREHLDRDSHGLARASRLILPNDGSELVLVIDQFEELFTLGANNSARKNFMDLLISAVTDLHSRVRVIIALRADYYDRPLQNPDFGRLVQIHLETLLPLSAEELERAIANPAHQNGMTFEPGLVATIIEEVNYRPGALPLLQFALAELYEQRDGRMLTQSAYQALGGAVGALARRAEELYQEQDSEGRETIRQMFLRLVSISNQNAEDTIDIPSIADTRKRVLRSELESATDDPDRMDEIIDTFAGYRLLTLDRHPATRRGTVELAHEAILREWDRLQGWLQESLVDLSLHHQLVQATQEWVEARSDQSFLLRGSRLERFETWSSHTSLVLTEEERTYLDASIALSEEKAAAERKHQEREARLERQSNRRLKALVIVMAVAMMVAIGLAIAAISFAQRAEEQRVRVEEMNRTSFAQAVASTARDNLGLDPELGLRLALEAANITYSVDGTIPLEVEALLRKAVQTDRVQHTINTSGVVAFSPDSKILAIGNQYGVVRLWDTTTGQNSQMKTLHQPLIDDMAFSPDSRFLATLNKNSSLHIWDVSSRQMIGYIQTETRINAIAFDSGGKHLLAIGADGAIRRWDLLPLSNHVPMDQEPIELTELIPILMEQGEALDLAYSPEGNHIAVLIPGKGIAVIDAQSEQRIFEITGIGYFNSTVTFSPEGNLLAGSLNDREATVWDVQTGEEILTVQEPAIIADIAFSPDGRTLATSADNGKTTLWEIETGQKLLSLSGHSSRISSIAFNPDGHQFVTSSDEGITRIWDLEPAGGELYNIAAHEGEVYDAVFNLDGSKIASAGEDGRVKIWEVMTGKLLYDLPGQINGINFPAFNPDGQKLAAANRKGGISIWDANSGEELLALQGNAPAYTAVAFSPDGDQIAAGGQKGIAHIWDASTGERLTDISYAGDNIMELVFTPDGEHIRTYDRSGIELAWNTVNGESKSSIGAVGFDGVGGNYYWDVEFTPDGLLGTAACYAATVFRADSKLEREELVYSLEGAGTEMTGVAMNPEGTILATTSTDGLAKLWNLETGEEIVKFADRDYPLNGVDFSPDGRYLVIAGSDGTISIYSMSIKDLMENARSRLSDKELTQEECQRYQHLRLPSCVEN